MPLSPAYVLEFGDVWLHDGDGRRHSYPVCFEGDQLGIAFSTVTGFLYKHGASKPIDAWAHENQHIPGLMIENFLASPAAVQDLNDLKDGYIHIDSFLEMLDARAEAALVTASPSKPSPFADWCRSFDASFLQQASSHSMAAVR